MPPRSRWDLPVLALGVSIHAPGLRLRRARFALAIIRANDVAFRNLNNVGTQNENVFGAQYWACMYPRALLHPTCYHDQRTTQGQRVWQGLRCKTLSFSTPSRFIPALSQTLFFVFRRIPESIKRSSFCSLRFLARSRSKVRLLTLSGRPSPKGTYKKDRQCNGP